jgi:hypothetical protein
MTNLVHGRILTDYEQEAWDNYNRVLDEYHQKYNVRHYDRPSVHKVFPEIQAAFDSACAATTFYRLCQQKNLAEIDNL